MPYSWGLSGAPIEGLDVLEVTYDGWLAEWMARLTGGEKLSVLPQPDSLQGQLRPYQLYGYSWLDFLRRWRLGACLADDMGLGKTIQTLAMLLRIKEDEGALPGPVLLVAPTSVVTNWAREAETFAPGLQCAGAPGRAAAARRGAAGGSGAPRRGAEQLCGRAPGCTHLEPGRLVWRGGGRGAEHQERRYAAGTGDAQAARHLPPGADGHAGGEPADRAVVDHALPESRLPGVTPERSADSLRCRSSAMPTPRRPTTCGG